MYRITLLISALRYNSILDLGFGAVSKFKYNKET